MENSQTQVNTKKEKVIKGVMCPSCNGALDLSEGVKSFNCKYCGSLLVVRTETSGTLKYYVPRKLKKEDAINKVYNWLGSGLSKAKGLRANSKITDAFLVYIPYWRVTADVVGWIFGREKKTRTTSSGTETYYVDVENKIQKTFDRTYSACDVAELGVKQVNLTGDEILPVDFETLQSEGMLFNIVSSEKEVVEFAKNEFIKEAVNSDNLYEITFEHFDIVRHKIRIVYYPLWVIRYEFANRTYQVVVDGEDGSICYGKAPGNNLYRAVIGIIGTAAGVFLATLFGIFTFIESDENLVLGVFFLSFITGIFCIRWAYKKFRYGGEIEEGTGILKERKTSKSKNLIPGVKQSETTEALVNVAKSVAIGGLASMIFKAISDRK